MPSSASPPPALFTLSLHDALPICIGYQVIGDGPPDVLYMYGTTDTIDIRWEWPPYAHFLRRLAAFSRVITFDRRGQGASDPVSHERSEEHTSELQSHVNLVCRLLLRPPPRSSLFPYTTLFRSASVTRSSATGRPTFSTCTAQPTRSTFAGNGRRTHTSFAGWRHSVGSSRSTAGARVRPIPFLT